MSLLVALAAISMCQTPSGTVGQRFQWNWRSTQTAINAVAKDHEISAAERESLLDALTGQFEDDAQARERATETRIKVADLNGDGIPEVIAQAAGDICSPTGNCPFWVFKKTASGYMLILKRGAIQNFTIQPTRTSGYSDLVLGMHGSATEQGLFLYQFRQGKYRLTACYDANWTYMDKNDRIHDLKDPRITPCR